ncbi:MAG: hypothetical protein ACREDE_10850, partial [Thermoplasmata archaeon]
RAAVAVAVLLAAVGSWTRVFVGGSNDFVFAFPLVLLLAGQAFGWLRGRVPSLPDALAFGMVVGYSAALNPVGAEWLIPALLLAGVLVRPALSGAPWRWLARWVVATAAVFVALIPTLYVLVLGRNSPGLIPGAGVPPGGTTVGISGAQFTGSIDPYLFRPGDVWLSPLPALRLELAVLLTVGVGILFVVRRPSAIARYLGPFRSFIAAGIAITVALLGLLWAATIGFVPAVRLAELSSAAELSIWLFTFYTFIGGLLVILLLERIATEWRRAPGPGFSADPRDGRRPRSRGFPRGAVPVLIVLVLVVPGVALTPTELPPVLSTLYHDFGNVSADDLALLEYAGAHLPAGSRVLIAPGSAAGFLPGYAPDLVLLYP